MPTPEELANNNVLTVLARFAMIGATVALPLVGWMAQRGITTVDEISHKVDAIKDQLIEAGGTMKLIQNTQQIQGATLSDHESRLRAQERAARPTPAQ